MLSDMVGTPQAYYNKQDCEYVFKKYIEESL